MQVYLVGGAVRDMLLGRVQSDRDFSFSGSIDQFMKQYPKAFRASRSFPVLLLHNKEFSPLRGEDIEADLAARDLTINALALEAPKTGESNALLHMHPKGLEDLRNKVLRPCSGQAMEQDPLRVFRAARFAAQFPDFLVHDDLYRVMREAASDKLMHSLAAERICAELRKALAAPCPDRFILLLQETGCLEPWFAELSKAGDIPAGPPQYHGNTVLEHTLQVMRALSGEPLHVWMGLTHDLGKGDTPKEMLPQHLGHEERGADLARAMGERLALPQRFIKAGEMAARFHMTCSRYQELKPGTKVDLLVRLDSAGVVEAMFDLAFADRSSGLRGDEAVDHGPAALTDLALIKEVELPEKWRNLGAESGERLRHLRCEALARTGKRSC